MKSALEGIILRSILSAGATIGAFLRAFLIGQTLITIAWFAARPLLFFAILTEGGALVASGRWLDKSSKRT
jgi:hypothetical protein